MPRGYAQIKDGTGTKVSTIEKTEGADNIETQRLAQDWDKLDFGGATPNALNSVSTPGSESGDIDCLGLSTILLAIEYSASSVTAPFWIVLMDANGTVGRIYSIKVTPANTGEQDDIRETGYYHGEGVILPTYGATNFRVVLAEAPSNSGSVSVWAKAV